MTTDERRGVQGLKLWQRRYFVFSLEGECVLRYFGDENEARSSEPRGTIDLGGAVIAQHDMKKTRFEGVLRVARSREWGGC